MKRIVPICVNICNMPYITINDANIYYQEKQLDSSIIYYEKTLKYFPDKENVRINLANIYSEKGEFKNV